MNITAHILLLHFYIKDKKQLILNTHLDYITLIFYEAVLNLPYDILEKLADPFQGDAVTNDTIKTGLALRKNLALVKKEYSLSAMNSIIDHLSKGESFESPR